MASRGPGELGDEDAVGVRSMILIHLDRIELVYANSKSAGGSRGQAMGRRPPNKTPRLSGGVAGVLRGDALQACPQRSAAEQGPWLAERLYRWHLLALGEELLACRDERVGYCCVSQRTEDAPSV